ncbi:MAG TPA: hypothetical protein VGK19_14470 [Capsulimonadaceae bacterium]|jgi:antitoxin component of RelBE/YafQ-DinJ toxin-antitoxin module
MTTVTLSLDNDIDQAISRLAEGRGLTREDYIELVLREIALTPHVPISHSGKSGAEIVDLLASNDAFYLEGRVGDVDEYAHQLREQSQRRQMR